MSLITNAMVTLAEGATYLMPNGAYPTGYDNRCMSKSLLTSYYYVDATYLTSFASNQLVPYQNIVAAPTYTITIYAKSRTSSAAPFRFWYAIGSNSAVNWKTLTISTTPSYSNLSTISIPQGAILYLGVTNTSNASVSFGTGNGGSTYTGYCGITTSPYSVTPSSSTSYYLNCNTTSGNIPSPC